MRSITVGLPQVNRIAYEVGDALAVKNLHSFRPSEYFERSSDPETGLKERAALQSLKTQFNAMHELKEMALGQLREGTRPKGLDSLYVLRNLKFREPVWPIYDHLLQRYTIWCIKEVNTAKRCLRLFGLKSNDLNFYALHKSKSINLGPRPGFSVRSLYIDPTSSMKRLG